MTMASNSEEVGQALIRVALDAGIITIAVDTESAGLKVGGKDDTCIGVSIAFVLHGTAYSHYFPFHHVVGDNYGLDTLKQLKELLESEVPIFVFANAQFDILSLDTIGIRMDDTYFVDICTMAHLINENKPFNKGLDSLGHYYLDGASKVYDPKIEKEKKTGWQNTTPEMMWDYATTDAELTWRVWDKLQSMKGWQELPENIWPDKQDLIRVLLAMRRRGVKIDQRLAREYVDKGEAEMERIKSELDMNPASPMQLKKLLIDELGLPVVRKSAKTGKPSFDKMAMVHYDTMLEKLDSPVAKHIKEFRGWQKAVSAAYKPYLELLDSDGRLRCSYKTHGTATGRLSCSEPNLQQIPKASDKPWNGKVKECFIAEDGYTLVNADFSQLELRLATAYAKEEELQKVFNEGRDIFTEMSKQLGMSRQDTKTLVYSMQYGAGEKRIMDVFGVTKIEAQHIRENYFITYPKFRQLNERCTSKVNATGTIKIWTGRERHFEDKNDGYKAMNSVIQGGAADIVERIMVQCYKQLENDDCHMLLQVHDSITFEVKTELVDEYMERIRAVMENVNAITRDTKFDVLFAVDVGLWVGA
jgi:DNA polymerase-1